MNTKIKIIGLFLLIAGKTLYGQSVKESAKIEIPETYELSNIILALTDYGISDEWEVQKKTDYYKNMLQYFEPVKNHPLLDSANYSREKWDYYLAFRTDAVAYSFDKNNKLKKDFDFETQPGLNPFGNHLDLINDFVEKSNFRKFYSENKSFYEKLINNYKDYNFINETLEFLDAKIGKSKKQSQSEQYHIILSPLVYRMNCHRQLSENIVADFPSATEDFINGNFDNENLEDRLDSNHLIFTEKDHEYINPITNKYLELVNSNFNTKYWDKESGYEGFNVFNEYMTWAVYDLFLEEKFPNYVNKLSTYWQYQNASRGFFAQNLFSDKVKELYKKNKGKKFENIYKPLLEWTKEIEQQISLPAIESVDTSESTIQNLTQTNYIRYIQVNFSESMNTEQPFGVEIREIKNGKQTENKKYVEITEYKWTKDGKTLNFKIDSDWNEVALTFNWNEVALTFNWWGIEKPLISKKGIFLKGTTEKVEWITPIREGVIIKPQ
ncbi:MAG: DUF4932 domain-containing protein [Flavobacteriaceae bacterium]|nr:DUF4932 domain-containing protein [Flavobacteriaceae bacterium]